MNADSPPRVRCRPTLEAVLVSGDKDLLGLSDQLRVYSPAEFVALIKASS